MNKRLRTILLYLTEAVISLALVLVFFSFFLFILELQFPSGGMMNTITGLRSIISRDGGLRQKGLDFFREMSEGLGGRGSMTAILSTTNNIVKSKRYDSIAWQSAKEGMTLYDRDAVQTYNRSSARVKFDPKSHIDMRENSLIIIKKLEKDIINNEKRSFIVVADGEFRGRFLSSQENPVYLELETPNAMARIRTTTPEESAVDFKITINEDKTSSFVVYDGEAEVEAQGVTVRLGANQMTWVGIDDRPAFPRDLPRPLELVDPPDDLLFAYRSLPPMIRFSWEKIPGDQDYFFQLAPDLSFLDPLFEERVERNGFEIGSLKSGTYYWRVAQMVNGNPEVFSEARALTVTKDTVPPPLSVDFPEGPQQGSVTIAGSTSRDSIVYIGNDKISVDASGNFVYDLKLREGINVVVVEAADPAGNTTYMTKLIKGRL